MKHSIVWLSTIFGVCAQSAGASENWEIMFQAKAHYLCEWIEVNHIQNNIPLPRTCSGPQLTADRAWDDVHDYFSRWRSADYGAGDSAEGRFGSDWNKYWSKASGHDVYSELNYTRSSANSAGNQSSSDTRHDAVPEGSPPTPQLHGLDRINSPADLNDPRAAAITACKRAMWSVPGSFGQSLSSLSLCDANPNAALELRRAAAQPPPAESSSSSSGRTGVYVGDRVSGMNRLCMYNAAGSAYVVTVGVTDICPLTPP
jgi:hypothetical protein